MHPVVANISIIVWHSLTYLIICEDGLLCCAVCCVSAVLCCAVWVLVSVCVCMCTTISRLITFWHTTRQVGKWMGAGMYMLKSLHLRYDAKERIEKRGSEKGCHCRLMIIIVKLMQTINMLYAWVRACKIVLKLGSHYNGNSIESYTVTMNFSEPANVLYIVLSALFVFCWVYFDVTIWLEEDFWFSRLHRSTIDSKIMK